MTGFVPAMAQKILTLDQCISEALSNNLRLKNADNDIKAAEHSRKETFTNFFPSVSAMGIGMNTNNGLMQMETGPGQTVAMMKNGVSANVMATMPLYAGGQLTNAYKLQGVALESSKLQKRMTENEFCLTTEQYYWQMVSLKEKLRTMEMVEKQLESIHNDVDAAVKAGVTNRNDLLQVMLRQNETKSGRIQLENALATVRSLLAQFIGHHSDSIDVMPLKGEALPERPESVLASHKDALLSTSEYQLLEKSVEANKLQKRLAVGKNLPSVAIGGAFMYDNFMDKSKNTWLGFATVSVPISGWWGGTHAVRKQKLALQNAQNDLADKSEQLLIRMDNNWRSLTDAYKQVEISLQSITQATENLRLQTDYYHAGTCTMSDLLEAQSLFQQNRDKYVEIYSQYMIKKRGT